MMRWLLGTATFLTAPAAILGTLFDVAWLLPSDVTLDQTESDSMFLAFDERQCVVLSNDLVTDHGTIEAGTTVSCSFLHADPVTVMPFAQGKILFDSPIIGVISLSDDLDASDAVCGLSAVEYPAAGDETYRGLGSSLDRYQIVAGGRGLHIQLDIPTASDHVRVITCCGNCE